MMGETSAIIEYVDERQRRLEPISIAQASLDLRGRDPWRDVELADVSKEGLCFLREPFKSVL